MRARPSLVREDTLKGTILDRDGTLIDFHRDTEMGAVVSAFHPSQLRILPGVIDGLRLLHDAGFILAVATNQPGPAKGQVSRASIELTNHALVEMLGRAGVPIASVASCFHHPEGGPGGEPELARECDCRKPLPGLLVGLIKELALDVNESWMIGDSEVDVRAGRAAGVRTGLLIDTRRCELCPLKEATGMPEPTLVAPRLDVLVAAMLRAPGRLPTVL